MDETPAQPDKPPPGASHPEVREDCGSCQVGATIYEFRATVRARRHEAEPLSAAEINSIREVMQTCPVARRILAEINSDQHGGVHD
jgi:hypothetical protein